MTHITSDPQGLHVGDVIAELQRCHPMDRTNINEFRPAVGAIKLVSDRTEEITESIIGLQRQEKTAKAAAEEEKLNLARIKAETAALLKNADRARHILRRLKIMKRQRTIPNP